MWKKTIHIITIGRLNVPGIAHQFSHKRETVHAAKRHAATDQTMRQSGAASSINETANIL